jgi:hypothetical protein
MLISSRVTGIGAKRTFGANSCQLNAKHATLRGLTASLSCARLTKSPISMVKKRFRIRRGCRLSCSGIGPGAPTKLFKHLTVL